VRPVAHPNLTDFCTELTGIRQEMVQDQEPFPAVLARFTAWYDSHGLSPGSAALVTCGQWDLATMLREQCLLSGLQLPHMLDVAATGAFVNIKRTFQKQTGKYGKVRFGATVDL
jgi:inhibitor of KinA sporulation pathway (predicted exonuclease)